MDIINRSTFLQRLTSTLITCVLATGASGVLAQHTTPSAATLPAAPAIVQPQPGPIYMPAKPAAKSEAKPEARSAAKPAAQPAAKKASAQPPVMKAATPAAAPDVRQPLVTLDRIAFIVNNEAVTQSELNEETQQVLRRMKVAKVTPPPAKELERQVVERMITDKALMQQARQTGIRIDDTMVQRMMQQIAQENRLSLEDLRRAVEKEGLSFNEYREQLRQQLAMQRLREREIDSHVVVTDAEIDSFLAMVKAQTGNEAEYEVSHILVAVPDQATPDIIDKRRARAEQAVKRLTGGEGFAEVAASMSDAPDALSGGSLGWRSLARLPSLFASTVVKLQKGQISGIMRSPAGFHIIKLVDVRDHNAPTVIEQTHARHILTRVNETQSEEEAHQKILRAQQRLRDGASFETVASLMSEDLSSSKGGDLGWLSPGDTVPDFERAMNALPVGGVSEIIRSPFGWHIIQVVERRQQDVTQERQRIQARMALVQRKAEEMFESYARQTRDDAYVEYKIDVSPDTTRTSNPQLESK